MLKEPCASPCSASAQALGAIPGWAHYGKSQQKSYLLVAKVFASASQGHSLSVRTLLGFLTSHPRWPPQLHQAGVSCCVACVGVSLDCTAVPSRPLWGEGPCAVLPRKTSPAGVLRHPQTASPSMFVACFPAI